VVPLAFGLALAAAVFHAAWNTILARASDNSAAMAVAMVVGAAVIAPLAVLRWRVTPEAVPYIAVSASLELAYFAMLAWAYRRAELSLVYPIARGLAPVLVLVGGVAFAGAVATPEQALGVVLVGAGVVLVRGLRAPASMRDVALAASIAVLIGGYTLIDKRGLNFADALPYLFLVVGIPGSVYMAAVLARGGLPRVRAATSWPVVLGGIEVVGGYGLVLAALTLAPAASVSAVREVSVVMATAMAAIIVRERVEPARWLGSVVVVGGIALVVAA
jgi:drug/metabolite transporter (DMT)-like permease